MSVPDQAFYLSGPIFDWLRFQFLGGWGLFIVGWSAIIALDARIILRVRRKFANLDKEFNA